ncbi:hypothetical protein F5Y19DRAFT_466411 [Xylariaceae sp. FL1651]|nr:hypothetical protein F5Y19DRAFT_466411 [Xylariaceae sp. FL1651]
MKISFVFVTFALAVSAYRCKFDRISNGQLSQLCSDSDKVGDQTESDHCSNKHSNSCYKVHHGTPGDGACRLVITAGGGCDADDTVLSTVPCLPGSHVYIGSEHSYKVYCD